MSSVRKFVGDTAIYGLTTITSRMVGFLMTPLYLRHFRDTGVYGIYSNFYAWVSMLNAVLAFGMETTYFRYLEKVGEKDKNKVYDTGFLVTLATSGLLLATVFLWTKPIAGWFANGAEGDSYEKYVRYFAFILVADALAVVPFAKLRAKGRPIRYSFLKFANIFTTLAANLFFIVFLPGWVETSVFWAGFARGWFVEGWIGYVFLSNLFASCTTLVLLLPELLSP